MVVAVIVDIRTRILARATTIATAGVAVTVVVVAGIIVVVITIIVARIVVIIIAVVVAMMIVVTITVVVIIFVVVIIMVVVIVVVIIVIMVVMMITVVVVRMCRLAVRRTVVIVVVVGVAVVIVVMVRRMTLYPIRSGVIHVYGSVPKVVGRPRLVPNYCVIMRTHVERTPQYRCRCHCNHRGYRRSNVHVVVVGGNSYPRTMEPLDSHLVRIVDVVLDVVNVAAVNLRVGGYCGNHRHYYE